MGSKQQIKVGLIDTALSGARAAQFSRYELHQFHQGDTSSGAHGSAVTASWVPHARAIELFNAAIFDDSLRTNQAQLIEALEWLAERGVALIHMSLGLRQPNDALTGLCERLSSDGILLVASAPAQGEAVYPANFSGVISASGDARCQPGELSLLSAQWCDAGPQWGGCVFSTEHPLRGASIGAGAVSGALLAELVGGLSAEQAIAALDKNARYRGREQRQAQR